MSRKTDQIKGRIKEAAGVLTDNERLTRKETLDQVVRKVKETAEKAVVALVRRTTPATGPSGTFALYCNRPKAQVKASHDTITRR